MNGLVWVERCARAARAHCKVCGGDGESVAAGSALPTPSALVSTLAVFESGRCTVCGSAFIELLVVTGPVRRGPANRPRALSPLRSGQDEPSTCWTVFQERWPAVPQTWDVTEVSTSAGPIHQNSFSAVLSDAEVRVHACRREQATKLLRAAWPGAFAIWDRKLEEPNASGHKSTLWVPRSFSWTRIDDGG
jgi:hypothetical protein